MVEVTHLPQFTLVVLSGRFTALEEAQVRHATQALLSAAEEAIPPRMIVDMSAAEQIGSSFIELMVRVWRRLKVRDGTLVFCGLRPFCREILRVTRLDQVWPIVETRDEAVQVLLAQEKL